MNRFTKMVLGLTSLTSVEMILDLFFIELELSCQLSSVWQPDKPQ